MAQTTRLFALWRTYDCSRKCYNSISANWVWFKQVAALFSAEIWDLWSFLVNAVCRLCDRCTNSDHSSSWQWFIRHCGRGLLNTESVWIIPVSFTPESLNASCWLQRLRVHVRCGDLPARPAPGHNQCISKSQQRLAAWQCRLRQTQLRHSCTSSAAKDWYVLSYTRWRLKTESPAQNYLDKWTGTQINNPERMKIELSSVFVMYRDGFGWLVLRPSLIQVQTADRGPTTSRTRDLLIA